MNPRAAKVLGDLKESPLRSLLVVLAILLGTAAMTVGVGTRAVIQREMRSSYDAGRPAAAILTVDAVDERLLGDVRRQAGVAAADSRRLVRARAQVGAGDWRPLLIYGVRDFADMRVSKVRPLSGASVPREGEALVERSALPVLKARVGETLRLRLAGGRVATLRVAGVVVDPAQAPGNMDNVGYIYVTPATLALLGQGARLDEVRIAVDGDRRQAGQVAEAVAAMAKAQNRPVLRVEVPVREHPHAQHMKAVLLLLTLFGGLALVLSGALTANVITGLLARQVRQIGVLKAIGARTGQICGLYGALTALLAGPGVVLGLALGVLGVQAMSRPISLELNLNPDSLAVPPDALLLVAAFAVIVPALAVALPIRRAVGRPVRELLQDPGLSAPDATPWRWRIGDRRTTLALRNTVRRPGRLALTMIALGLGGAALMTCANLYASLVRGVDQALAGRADSVEVRLAKPLPAEAFRARIAALPGVQSVEVWGATLAAIQLPGDGAARLGTNPYAVLAPPPGSRMVGARLVDGRWPRRRGEIVINRNILSLEPALGQGQAVLLSGGRSVPVHVVGLVEEVSEPHIYAAASTVDALVGQGGLAGASRLVARPGEEARVSAAVEDLAAEMGSLPSYAATRQAFRQTLTEHFAILLTMLSVAAAAAIAVGGLGLAATASLNVLERRREIGVLRALGARRATLRMILLAEGALIALASSLAAVLVALPLSAHIGLILGRRQLFTTLPFVVEPAGLLIWLGVVTIVTLAACWGAADRALKLPVRDVLAYE